MTMRTTKNTRYPIDGCWADLVRHAESVRLHRRNIITDAEMLERTTLCKDTIVQRVMDWRSYDRSQANRHPFKREENPHIEGQLHVLLGDIIQRFNNNEVLPTESDVREDIYRLFRFAIQF